MYQFWSRHPARLICSQTLRIILLHVDYNSICRQTNVKLKSRTLSPQSCAGSVLSIMVLKTNLWPFRSSRERSSHTHERETLLPQEKSGEAAVEGWREDKAEYGDWEDRQRSPSADTARGKDRERSLSYERDRRSSSEERESGEIWTGGDASKVFDLDILFSKKRMERWVRECVCDGANVCVRVSFVCVFMLKVGHVH